MMISRRIAAEGQRTRRQPYTDSADGGESESRVCADSPTAQNGAPIIRSDGVVVGGTRSIAINSAYNDGKSGC